MYYTTHNKERTATPVTLGCGTMLHSCGQILRPAFQLC